MSVAVSVVIPAYNAEKFLGDAVDSVLRQTLSDWELLIVENGSTDGTSRVAEEFLDDGRIRLMHSEKGVSCARNVGLAHAQGNWVLFLDADDSLPEDAMELLLGAANAEQADVVMGEYAHAGHTYTGRTRSFRGREEIALCICKCMNEPTQYCTSTAVLFSRDLLVSTQTRFDETLSHAEDSAFFLQVLQKAKTVAQVDKPVYCVGYNLNSAVHTQSEEQFQKYKKSILKIESMLEKENEVVRRAVPAFVLCQVLVIFVNNTFASSEPRKIQIQNAREILCDPVVEAALEQVDLTQCGKTKGIAFWLMQHKWMAMLGLMSKVRQRMNKHRAKGEKR